MQKILFVTALLSIAFAKEDEDADNFAEADGWDISETVLARSEWKSCTADADCAEGHICVENYWVAEDGEGRAKGCNPAALCKGTGAWKVNDEKFQMLCSEEQKQKAEAAPALDLFEVDAEPISSEVEGCNEDADCSDGDGDQGCFPYFINLDDTGNNWDLGRGCFETDL